MFEKKPLMVENTSVKTWKTPTFNPEPSPSFLYPQGNEGFSCTSSFQRLFRCREREERKKRKSESFYFKLFFNIKQNVYKVLFGMIHTTKPITNYQKIQIKHYNIGRKWEKHKNKKVKAENFVEAKKIHRATKIRNPCEF